MEVKNIHKNAGWFASYMNAPDGGSDSQGKALVECQILKIKQLQNVLGIIKGEIELAENPKEHPPELILESIKVLIEQIPEVSFTDGFFKWVG